MKNQRIKCKAGYRYRKILQEKENCVKKCGMSCGIIMRPTKMSRSQGSNYSGQERTASGDETQFLSERCFILLGMLKCFLPHKKLKSQENHLRFDNKLIVKGQL